MADTWKQILVKHATTYAEGVEWLDKCPFRDGQPFYETANEFFHYLGEEIAEKAHMLHHHFHVEGAEAVLNDVQKALEDNQWGEFGDNEAAFWRDIVKRAEALPVE